MKSPGRYLGLGLALISYASTVSVAQEYDVDASWRKMCPQMYPTVFPGYAPRGNKTAGAYRKRDGVRRLEPCIADCCARDACNVVFMHHSTCYQITCKNNELCVPLYRPEPKFVDVTMVLVKPVLPSVSWDEVVFLLEDENTERLEDVLEAEETRYPSSADLRTCEVGMLDCPRHESCVGVVSHSRSGLCRCDPGYSRNASGTCVLDGNKVAADMQDVKLPAALPTESSSEVTKLYSEGDLNGQTVAVETSSTKPLKKLVVSAVPKEVRLPENAVTLSAYTVPAEQSGEHYKYEWTLMSQPEGGSSGTMNDQNGGTLKLSNLIEGLYTFKVSVTAPAAYGEATTNVTVLPQKRINQPPVAIISPAAQTVKLPNTGAVLDGSSSRDDDRVVGWRWELQQGPLGYQPRLVDVATLQLDNLVVPGNYTFKLTVEDSDHATNSTTANITVLKVPDYPPEANAGQDVLVYLPRNNLTLNGNLSTDDRGIASWEWTKSPSDQDKAVDMQNTRTPYLQLSNLEKGMYTFVLKVTDTSGQSSSAEVHVFVQLPTNQPPVADAGEDGLVSLPQTWVQLNGSRSHDDIKIAAWQWQQLSGPSKVSFSPANSSITNVTELTKGEYKFQLTVTDDSGNKATDTVTITVTQNQNARPKADAGGDQTISLPVSVVLLNGSRSSDDLGIVKWEWTREGASLAMGTVLGVSRSSPVLMLTDVVPGRYVFRLRVTDDQGLSDDDVVSIFIKPDPQLLQLVELTLNVEAARLTRAQLDSLVLKLSLLLREDAGVQVRALRPEDRTGRAVLVFLVARRREVLPGPAVVARLREKLARDSGLLELGVAGVRTAVCQNNCSGHGVCDQATRQCLCEAFWMQDLISKHFQNGESNCDWSVLYVVILLFVSVVVLVGGAWGLVCLFQRACVRRPRKRQKYALLDDGEDHSMLSHSKIMLSESESDSDVLFESRKCKMNGDVRNGHKARNGFAKIGRRIKT
ncbi:dyslexia-associated protein KIAA0319-like protein isoform X2 [Bacillus rossius redtenbacheri]